MCFKIFWTTFIFLTPPRPPILAVDYSSKLHFTIEESVSQIWRSKMHFSGEEWPFISTFVYPCSSAVFDIWFVLMCWNALCQPQGHCIIVGPTSWFTRQSCKILFCRSRYGIIYLKYPYFLFISWIDCWLQTRRKLIIYFGISTA